MASQIVHSDLAGHESHGVRRLVEYVRRAQQGAADPAATPVVEVDTGTLVRLDGRGGYGHLVIRQATDIAIERARRHGIAAVAVRRSEWAGRLAPFCEQAATAGVALLMFVNDSGTGQVVAPPGGTAPRLSTNPIGAGIPRAQGPHLVLDIATSTIAMGRLSEERDRGTSLPQDWITDNGLLRPFGGRKGFGLALIAEALAGTLTSAGTVSADADDEHQGALLIALDIAQLRPLGEFTSAVDDFAAYIAETPLEPGADPILMPGESSAANIEHRRTTGVPVAVFTWRVLSELADELGVPPPHPS